MGIGILGAVVLLCVVVAQIMITPINALSSFHIPAFLGVGKLFTWIAVGGVLLLGAWLLGDG